MEMHVHPQGYLRVHMHWHYLRYWLRAHVIAISDGLQPYWPALVRAALRVMLPITLRQLL
jgi:hypothetical protein